jgi:hypothetical protein
MKNHRFTPPPHLLLLSLLLLPTLTCSAQRLPNSKAHDRNQAQPPQVTPGTPSSPDHRGSAPSDAIVLFDGSSLEPWVSMDGSPTRWTIESGVMRCVPESGYIRTRRSFGDCQLHVEWASPAVVNGKGQGRGNSGVFLGLNRYEVQILDSFENLTYADGGAAAIYGQYPPLVNASLPPGSWQTYDILYRAPRFDAAGRLTRAATLTVLHNGVLVQHESELTGPTAWIGHPPYVAHPVKLPIALQDHGNPLLFRKIWVREIGPETEEQWYFSDGELAGFCGTYASDNGNKAHISLMGEGRLQLDFGSAKTELFCSGPARFFASSTDMELHFESGESGTTAWIGVADQPSPFRKISGNPAASQ